MAGALLLGVAGPAAAAQTTNPAQVVDVSGTFADTLGGTGTFDGTLTLTRFANVNGNLAVVGRLTGTLTDSAGTVIGEVNRLLTLPVTVNATCEILHLELGPLDLNLLGLMVHLDKIVLDITAQQGPGNLLGNLLCALAGLLDGGLDLNALIVGLLNRILMAL
jgi:hypothetical protein